jgi:hypothetical protein
MKTLFLASSLVALTTSNAHGLSETNCRNEDGSIQRVEEEIWGANPIHWIVAGQMYDDSAGSFEEGTRVLLETRTQPDALGLETVHERFQVRAHIRIATDAQGHATVVSDTLVCESWRNDAID